MFTFVGLKHNKLEQVSIPKPIELYKQFGLSKQLHEHNYSGDEYLDPSSSKVDIANQVSKEAFEKSEE